MLYDLFVAISEALFPYLYFLKFKLLRYYYRWLLNRNTAYNYKLYYREGWPYAFLPSEIRKKHDRYAEFLYRRRRIVEDFYLVNYNAVDSKYQLHNVLSYDLRRMVRYRIRLIGLLFLGTICYSPRRFWLGFKTFIMSVRVIITVIDNRHLEQRWGWWYYYLEPYIILKDEKSYNRMLWKRKIFLRAFRRRLVNYSIQRKSLLEYKKKLFNDWKRFII